MKKLTQSFKTVKKNNYPKRTISLIIAFFILRWILAFILELGNDEAYYWTYSKFLKWNYFDHPPMIAYSIRLFTANLLLQQYEGFIRLGSVAGCALSTWFIFKATALLSSERAGWYAALLYSTSFYAGIIAGLHAMPDAPQMVFWTFSLWMLAKISKNEQEWKYWLLFGIGAGLCIMSKVHGIFLWVGPILYFLFCKKPLLARPQLYVSLFLSLLIASPILIWNINNDFATFLFHSNRVTIYDFRINAMAFMEELAGQVFFNNPFHVIIIVSALFAMHRNYFLQRQPLILFNFIALPLAILLLLIAVFRDTLPHWSGPAYITLLPLAGIFIGEKCKNNICMRLVRWGVVGFLAFVVAWPLVNNLYPGTFGKKKGIELGKGDVTLDKFGWLEAGKHMANFYQNQVAQGKVPDRAPLVCYKWWGAHVEYYFCRPLNIEMVGLGAMNTLHEYYWTNGKKIDKVNMDVAFCVVPSDEYYNARNQFSGYYNRIDSVATIAILRNDQPAHNFYIYRLSGWKGVVPAEQ